ncbi:hypothetical protein MCOR27_001418 [Pyricularia oryzae]|uniref:Phosphotransferase n=2 Tax=Pyricularia TaxID=48558 RepID=A0ABQ8NPC0_PYRGI|nr:hypothetical protein MCOR01_010399 [Pyricularia oryzae]KAI6299241.1 hypothetical protein MCOR33_004771 [Pyricularia grisea]KAH9438629.1 hypothetical protein MCOR02_002244 [Pyricularia oryzae]KAI6284244.1 hypothetical protein MCOR26_002096 [Pyricularia oryzae]KAI6287240.1 hypothetical protein MCOR27_001418 [Pyricularia oryzae]
MIEISTRHTHLDAHTHTMASSTISSQTTTTDLDSLETFLKPLQIDRQLVHRLAQDLCSNFTDLAAQSDDQFLPTPISESLLLQRAAVDSKDPGPHLAIDIGGTNLRVAFVELSHVRKDGHNETTLPLRRHLEHSWPIDSQLKNENHAVLFAWIGACIAEVVSKACAQFGITATTELPLGITFSFPMVQESLEKATLLQMGKGFGITSDLDLGCHLVDGYEKSRGDMPRIRVAAITNDAVATLVSFMHQFPTTADTNGTTAIDVDRRPAMGLICGTGSNATVFMDLESLKESKRPRRVQTLPGQNGGPASLRIAVNTEWSINGTAAPLRAHNLITSWDDHLSGAVERPGFQPLEYMTAGRYLGELGRLILVDYMTKVLGLDSTTLPAKLLRSFEPQNTTFLSHFRPEGNDWSMLVARLTNEFPSGPAFCWTEGLAQALYRIARLIEYRAAGIIAASTLALLKCSGALPSAEALASMYDRPTELQLGVGYTGGCITNFQDYLQHCQQLLDDLAVREYPEAASGGSRLRVVLQPCHDGGIDGAAVLVPAAVATGI